MNWNDFKLQTKIILMACLAVVLSVIAIIGILYHQGNTLKDDMSLEVNKMAQRELGHIAKDINNMVKAQDESVSKKVQSDLRVATYLMNQKGEIGLADEEISWQVTNQYTGDSQKIDLPKMQLGPSWLGQTKSMQEKALLVDQIQDRDLYSGDKPGWQTKSGYFQSHAGTDLLWSGLCRQRMVHHSLQANSKQQR